MMFRTFLRPVGHVSPLRTIVQAAVILVCTAGSLAAQSNPWRYSTDKPADGWTDPVFDDSAWQLGEGGFGTRSTPGTRVGTVWTSKDIWIRRTFELTEIPENIGLLLHHDDTVEVYINGKQVLAKTGWTTKYEVVPLDEAHRSVLKQGENSIAVHCYQDAGGQYIDVHFADVDDLPSLPPRKPFHSDLITSWGAEVTADNAWTEYPRPQLVRPNWQNLNGNWDYAITSIDQVAKPDAWDGEILVPFCLESKLGGAKKLLDENEALWYRRSFEVAVGKDLTSLLNFEAVDYRCEVFVNGTSVGKHQGGHTPFSLDVSSALVEGQNELVVRVEDATEGWQLRGKQVLSAHGIWYTQVSGIWQTVWLEQVAESHIRDLKISTQASDGSITVRSVLAGKGSVHIEVLDGTAVVAEATSSDGSVTLKVPDAKLWSPDSPHLYDIRATLTGADGAMADQVQSYAGIRTVGKVQDADGHWRMTLNGQPIFHWGPLDQGWWPDGLLTPPSDEGMLFDIEWLKSAGFNMIRKHIKIEPRRYYYHCDRLGMMVWQDQVSGGASPKWTTLEPNPTDAEWPEEHHKQFMIEFERMVDELESHPSIVVWGPFNEAWGQHQTVEVGKWTVKRDPNRLTNVASGGNFWPVGDIVDRHNYPHPAFPFDAKRYADYIKVVGEFGGHGLAVKGHLWDTQANNWGYGGLPKSKEEYRDRYVKSLEILNDLRKKGVAAGVYTQTTDVEGEINGLMTYDRKVIKIPAAELKEMHQQLFDR